MRSVRFHPDGTCIASGGADKVVKIYDVRSQKPIQHYDAANDAVNEVVFHPNGRYLLSASADSTVKIWDLRQGHILYSLYGHEGSSTTCAFSPGGDFFTSSGADAIVNVWKSNLNELETEVLDESSGFKRAAKKQPAAPRPNNGASRHDKCLIPSGSNSRLKPSGSATRIQNQPSPTRSGVGNADQQYPTNGNPAHVPGGGVTGSGEELALTLEKVVS